MNAQEFEVAFYEAMHKWVTGGKVGPDPRGEWECMIEDGWIGNNFPCTPAFSELGYRWKPTPKRTVTIDGVELVAPEVDAPTYGAEIFVETADGKMNSWKFTGSGFDVRLLANGKVFLTREDCQAMVDFQRNQRLGVTTGESSMLDEEELAQELCQAWKPLVTDHDQWRDWPGTYKFAKIAIRLMKQRLGGGA